jgi:hypothetical protein
MRPPYRELKAGFRSDLADERDFALACGAALVLVKLDREGRSSQTVGR